MFCGCEADWLTMFDFNLGLRTCVHSRKCFLTAVFGRSITCIVQFIHCVEHRSTYKAVHYLQDLFVSAPLSAEDSTCTCILGYAGMMCFSKNACMGDDHL